MKAVCKVYGAERANPIEPIGDCPTCDRQYTDFRTELTYQDIYDMLVVGSADPADWRYKRRGTVLGLWHQIKQSMWKQHIEDCEQEAEWVRSGRSAEEEDEVLEY
jgi:hypothetical protein